MQTSPYLTHVSPNDDLNLVYLTDTFGPAFPHVDPPPRGTAFGIIGLDRAVAWHRDARLLSALTSAAGSPRPVAELVDQFGSHVVQEAIDRDWLQPPEDLCREYRLVSGEIEVTAHCNWGCEFCPVATDPKPRQTMDMALFETIVSKLADLGTIDYVTFHFYNEPTLDKYFIDRVALLARYDLPLALYTNASGLNTAKIEALRQYGVLRHLIVNMPSADPDEFADLTGSRTYRSTVRNVDAAVAAGFRTQLVVNGAGERREHNLAILKKKYEPLGVEVTPTMTCDRAGDVGGEYFQNVHLDGLLAGCGWPVAHANFSVAGDMFLCCNDYYQRERFGNIRDGSIHDLMTSPSSIALRQRVFGVAPAAEDFICRRCHNQCLDHPYREFRPIATYG